MATSEIQVGWQDYAAIALRRKPYFLVPVSVSLVIGLLVLLFVPRVYEAQALIAVRSEKLINPLIQGLAMPSAVSERLQTLREEILSWSNLTKLVAKHRLDKRIAKNDAAGMDQLIQKLRKDINVKMKGTTLIQVTYTGGDPAKVQEIVNSLTDIVIERNSAIQKEEADTAIGFIEAELDTYRKKLEESERHLREFKEVYMTQMPIATALNSQLKNLEVELSNLLIENTEAHPRVVEVKRKIEEVRKQRDEEVRRLVAKGVLQGDDPQQHEELLNEFSAAQAASSNPAVQKAQQAVRDVVQGLEAPQVPGGVVAPAMMAVGPDGTPTVQMNDDAAATLTLAPRQQQELTRLTRDYSVNERIYRGLLEKLEKAKITGRLGADEEGGKFMVIERARYPLQPVSPQPVQTLLISLCAGLVLGIVAVMAAEYLDQSLQSAEEAMEVLELPVLGTISTIVTPGDLEVRRQRRQQWTSARKVSERLKASVIGPVWTRIDKVLVDWGL